MGQPRVSRRGFAAGSLGLGALLVGGDLAAQSARVPAYADTTSPYAPPALPAGIAGTGRYDPQTYIYTPLGVQVVKARARLAQVAVGTGALKVACVGASNVAGWNGSSSLRGTGKSWPEALRDALASQGYSVGEGSVRLNDSTAVDARWKFTGTWKTSGLAAAFVYAYSAASGSTLTMSSTKVGTIVEVELAATSAPLTLTIDQATPSASDVTVVHGTYSDGTVTPDGKSNMCRVTVSGQSSSHHVVCLQAVNSSPMVPVGVDVFPANSVRVANFGSSGTTSVHWRNTTLFYTLINEVLAWAPDVVVLDTGVAANDFNAGTPQATVLQNLQSIVDTFQKSGIEVYLNGVTPFISPTNGTPGIDFWQTFYTLADTKNCTLIDNYERWGGSESVAAANGLMGGADQVHPGAVGYFDLGQSVLKVVGA